MASTSAPGTNFAARRISSVAKTLYDDNQMLVLDFRRAFSMVKDIAVDLEKDRDSEGVKELESVLFELLEASEDCLHLSAAVQSLENGYVPGPEPTDFKKLFDNEMKNSKGRSSFVPQNHPFYRQFREAIWNVHHAGQPMPGEEQEDVVMTSTQCNLLNTTCPLSGKPVTELADPVRSMDCRHIYAKTVILQYIRSKKGRTNCPVACPVAGCPRLLQADSVVCDPMLLVEIDELRSMSTRAGRQNIIEDFTALDGESDGSSS